MTESEGNNFQLGTYKHPSRFLFEIKENLYVRQGNLPQEIIDGAKRQLEFENEFSKYVQPVLEVGDIVSFSVWGEGKVLEKDEVNKTYKIKFDKINAIRPIRFDWRGLRKIEKEDKQENIRTEYSGDIEGYWEEIEKLSNENKK
jgi:DNA helicase-2/ATP-dependent DNA helicase PcrA